MKIQFYFLQRCFIIIVVSLIIVEVRLIDQALDSRSPAPWNAKAVLSGQADRLFVEADS